MHLHMDVRGGKKGGGRTHVTVIWDSYVSNLVSGIHICNLVFGTGLCNWVSGIHICNMRDSSWPPSPSLTCPSTRPPPSRCMSGSVPASVCGLRAHPAPL